MILIAVVHSCLTPLYPRWRDALPNPGRQCPSPFPLVTPHIPFCLSNISICRYVISSSHTLPRQFTASIRSTHPNSSPTASGIYA